MADEETVGQIRTKLEQKLGQLLMQVGKMQKELNETQKQVNDTATAIEKLNG